MQHFPHEEGVAQRLVMDRSGHCQVGRLQLAAGGTLHEADHGALVEPGQRQALDGSSSYRPRGRPPPPGVGGSESFAGRGRSRRSTM